MKVSNQLTIYQNENYYSSLLDWCKKNMIVNNPEYEKKKRMGFWIGNTPSKLNLYQINEGNLVIPFGALRQIISNFKPKDFVLDFSPENKIDFNCKIPLYDYQEEAVKKLIESKFGILQSPCGTGKTQMGIALATMIGLKTLWLCNTLDLTNQSKDRAKQYMDESLLGTITEGKVNIGKGITFATVQTLSNLDLSEYKYEWGCIIVDECHHCVGTPTKVTQFSKVLNNLAAKHKYGLTAALSRCDGLERCANYLLGDIVHTVSPETIADKMVTAKIQCIKLDTPQSFEYLGTDGMLNYTKLLEYLCNEVPRTNEIASILNSNSEHYNLVLSDRLTHLKSIMALVERQDLCCMVDGSMTSKKGKEQRKQALEDMRQGKKHYLFATYSLAKEGLDIPRLDRLYLTTPHKDKSTILQSVGRIRRKCDGKAEPIVYDFVDDNIEYCVKAHKTRRTTYKKIDCIIDKKY